MSRRTKWDNAKREARARKPEYRPKKPPVWLGYRMPAPFKKGMYEKNDQNPIQ